MFVLFHFDLLAHPALQLGRRCLLDEQRDDELRKKMLHVRRLYDGHLRRFDECTPGGSLPIFCGGWSTDHGSLVPPLVGWCLENTCESGINPGCNCNGLKVAK